MDGGKEQFGGLQVTRIENSIAKRFSGLVVKAEDIDRNEHEAFSTLLKSQSASGEGIVNASGRIFAAIIAGECDGGSRRDIGARNTGQECTLGCIQPGLGPEQSCSEQKKRNKAWLVHASRIARATRAAIFNEPGRLDM